MPKLRHISKESQNDFIKYTGEAIYDRIIEEVKKSGLCSIIAGKARDCSDKEQMSLLMRYVDSSLDIQGDFVSFVLCENGLTGEKLASVLIKKIDSLSLEIENGRGQAYDGAGNVAGPKSGLARLNSKAWYMN